MSHFIARSSPLAVPVLARETCRRIGKTRQSLLISPIIAVGADSMRFLGLHAFAAVASLAVGAPSSHFRDPWTPQQLEELTMKLSADASVYWPGSEEFAKATERWSALQAPTVNIVVVPTSERDVSETVGPYVRITAGSAILTLVLGEVRQPNPSAVPRVQWRSWLHHHLGQDARRYRDLDEEAQRRRHR